MSLLCLLHTAKVDESLAAGFLRRKAGADARVRMKRNMGLKLGSKFVFGAAAAEKPSRRKQKARNLRIGRVTLRRPE